MGEGEDTDVAEDWSGLLYTKAKHLEATNERYCFPQ